MSDNWRNWLAAQSWLETDYRDEGNETSSARGYFQFLKGTAKMATDAGLPDPREGDYAAQAEATRKFIERFHPKAAAAIEAGKFMTAAVLLYSTWPSLPGGSQQQYQLRYDTWDAILNGEAPRPPGEEE